MSPSGNLEAYVVTGFVKSAQGNCAYTYINAKLNECLKNVSTSTTARWFFPHGTIDEQEEICKNTSFLQTCFNVTLLNCRQEMKTLAMFDIDGDNLHDAYDTLCNDTLKAEAHACMSVVSSTRSFVTAETAFTHKVTALPDDASATEICGLATTLKYTAYTTLLRVTCTYSEHLDVWGSFYDKILNTYVCGCSKATTGRLSHVVFAMCALSGMIWNYHYLI